MPQCRDLEPLFAPYVDGGADSRTRAAVDAHLHVCAPCRELVAIERAAREAVHVRRTDLRGCASEHLRRRCAAQRAAAGDPPVAIGRQRTRRTFVPFSIAASILLVAGVFFFGFSRQVEVLAFQFAADHVKCFQFAGHEAPHPPVDPVALAQKWAMERGWTLQIPSSTPDHHLELVGVRRCGSTDGLAAHMMYRWRGEPLSIYVMNGESRRATAQDQFVSTLGQGAVIWEEHGRTYAVVADAAPADLAPVIRYVKARAR